VRSIEGAPVATPLRWDEVGAADLNPRTYSIENIFHRLARTDDPWAAMAQRAASVGTARKRFAGIA
jgi:bifunctional non-homologous end joining protein LigD